MDLPQRPPRTRPLPRLRFIGSCPKCEKRLAAIHPSPPAHIAARDERRRSPAERTSALRSLFAPRACRCSFSQSKRYAAATTACLLPRAISPPMLTALFFCLASADRICLLRHCITFADFTTNILTDSPMSCSTFLSGTIAVLYCTVMCTVHSFGRRRSHRIAVPLAQHCDG